MKRIFKWIGIVLGSLIGLLLVAGVVMYFIGNSRLNKVYDIPPSGITLLTDAASIENGGHRVESLCAGCHGEDLSGIENFFDGGPLGTMDSANLTSGEGGIGDEYTAEDYVRAIRHGIDRDGKPIFMAAVVSTAYLSDEDLGSIISYMQTIPSVDHVTTGVNFTPLATVMFAQYACGGCKS